MIVGYVDEYEDLLENKRIRYNEEWKGKEY
jgi:hypothetical protein